MAGCFRSCMELRGCEDSADCCHACLYYKDEECGDMVGVGYFPLRFSRYVNQ